MAKPKLKVGDVFYFVVKDDEVGTGQIITKDVATTPYYFAIFEPLFQLSKMPDVKAIASSKIILLGGSFDARFGNGTWHVIGNTPPELSRIPFPNYKLASGTIDNHVLVNFDAKKQRKASQDEVELYDYRTNVSPMMLEAAFKAYHLHAGWIEQFEKLLFDYVEKRSKPL